MIVVICFLACLSSATYLSSPSKFIVSGEEKEPTFSLSNTAELDNANNEIDSIEKIITKSKETKSRKLNKNIIHTKDLDYGTFLDLITKDEYDIIHYNGHGYYDPLEPDKCFMFFWENKGCDGRVVAVDTTELSWKLRKTKNLKFFYLSCCQGAAADDSNKKLHNTYLGLQDAIVTSGVPNVLAMRWPITAFGSKKFACNFYESLLCGDDPSLEYAVCNARNQSLSEDDKSIWCSPMLIKQSF